MTESPWIAALLTLFVWWFSTGVILWRVRVADNGQPSDHVNSVVIGLPLVAIGIMAGLILGKPIGVVTTAWFMARFTRARLNPAIGWQDVLAVGMLAGIGFTVALLITELAYSDNIGLLDSAKTAVFTASVISALIASILLLTRNRHYRQEAAIEEADVDGDGIPDVYQQAADGEAGTPPRGTH